MVAENSIKGKHDHLTEFSAAVPQLQILFVKFTVCYEHQRRKSQLLQTDFPIANIIAMKE